MRKLGMVVVGLLCAAAVLYTPASVAAKAKAKEFKDQVTLSSSLKVGSTVLKPGDYQVTSDGSKITFKELIRSVDDSAQRVNTKGKAVSVPCQTKALPSKSATTQLDTTADPSGGTVLKGLTIRGSDVAFTVTN
jgi:hypothetical protein